MPATPEFAQVLKQLQSSSRPLPVRLLHAFSNLPPQDLAALAALWPDLPVERRRSVMQTLGELNESDFELVLDDVFRLGLEDEDGEVRATAVRALWECESADLTGQFLNLLQHDPAPAVRAAAATALGRYVYLGETEEFPTEAAHRLEDALLAVVRGEDDLDVRRHALEAVSFSSRPEVAPLIAEAYGAPEPQMQVSAIFAMGRSADKVWGPQVCAELRSLAPEIRFEAARAAGELELAEAVTDLVELTQDIDPQVCEAAIWSLSQVGGDQARQALVELLEAEDADEDFIQEALDNLDFTDEVQSFLLLDVDEADEPDDLPPGLKRNGRSPN